MLLEIAKGYGAVWLAEILTERSQFWMPAAAVAVMLGHAYPIYLKFKGGKAVATFIGAFLRLTPWALAGVLLTFVVTVAWTRHISMGSIVAAAVFPLAVWLLEKPPLEVVVAAMIAGAFIIYRHSSNLSRLRDGTEHEFTFGSKP